MVIVKILDEEKFQGHTIFMKKVVIFKGERAGDRIRVFKYFLNVDPNEEKTDIEYVGLDQEQSIIIFETMQEVL